MGRYFLALLLLFVAAIPARADCTGKLPDVSGVWNAKTCGAQGDAIYSSDGVHLVDGATVGAAFSSASGTFTNALIGDTITVDGAGVAGALYVGTVSLVPSTTSLIVSPAPSTNVTGAKYIIGFDNTPALQSWLNVIRNSTSPNKPQGYLPVGTYLHRGLDFSEISNLRLNGSGSSVFASGINELVGGSTLLCVAPTTSPQVCHDFTGNSYGDIEHLTFRSGLSVQTAGLVNVLTARLNSTYFSILNKWEDDVFQAWGTYDVVLYGAEQSSFIDSVINFNMDPATALYISASNTPGFTSPTRGALLTPPSSMTIVHVSGGKSQISSNGNPGIVFDNDNSSAGHPNAIYAISVDGAYLRPFAAGPFITDTCTHSCNSNAVFGLKNVSFMNNSWEPQNSASEVGFMAAPALNWMVSGNSYEAGLASTQWTFTNGFLDSFMQFEGTAPSGGTFLNAGSCTGSILQLGNPSPPSVNSACEATALTTITDNGVAQVNLAGGGLLGLGSPLFASLPTTCVQGQELYVPDAKSVADGVTMASTCVGSGAGSVAVCKAGNVWKCGQ